VLAVSSVAEPRHDEDTIEVARFRRPSLILKLPVKQQVEKKRSLMVKLPIPQQLLTERSSLLVKLPINVWLVKGRYRRWYWKAGEK